MTGWRMGWACGPAHLIKAMGTCRASDELPVQYQPGGHDRAAL